MFSPISEAVVLFSVPAVFWHLNWVLSEGGASLRKRFVIGFIVIVWTTVMYAQVRHGFADALMGGPAMPLVFLGATAPVAYVFRNTLLGDGVSQRLLISLQLFRPIGMLFVLEHSRGTLPPLFAHAAGWGDLLAGLLALYVLVRYWNETIPPRAVIAVAVVGLADFASAFFFGFTSSASPIQLFTFDNPNQVLEYPLGLIPVFLVPYAVIAHILSLSQLARDRRTSASSA